VLNGAALKAVEATTAELSSADCVVILTDHREFDYAAVIEHAALVIDTRAATWGLAAPSDRVIRL